VQGSSNSKEATRQQPTCQRQRVGERGDDAVMDPLQHLLAHVIREVHAQYSQPRITVPQDKAGRAGGGTG
jgi:hypothetical protein